MTSPPQSDRSRVRRLPERASYDEAAIHAIIDETLICHVGIGRGDTPVVIPMIHARGGSTVYLHGSPASGLLRSASETPLCLTFTLIDGLVLTRSIFHHSMNYRSAVVFGKGRMVTAPEEKLEALKLLVDHVQSGRWGEARPPSANELKQTAVVAVEIEEASSKTRSGPPVDDPADAGLPVWAGVIPITLTRGDPDQDPGQSHDVPLPDYLKNDAGSR